MNCLEYDPVEVPRTVAIRCCSRVCLVENGPIPDTLAPTMREMRAKQRLLCLPALAGLLVAPCASAAPDADALLKQAFDNYRAASSQASIVMTVHRPDWERQMSMNSWTRGDNDALVRFTAPQKDAGNATLKELNVWRIEPQL